MLLCISALYDPSPCLSLKLKSGRCSSSSHDQFSTIVFGPALHQVLHLRTHLLHSTENVQLSCALLCFLAATGRRGEDSKAREGPRVGGTTNALAEGGEKKL